MTVSTLFAWLQPTRRPTRLARRKRLALEHLEGREVPSVVLRDVPDTQIPTDKPIFIPITATNEPTGAVTYTANVTSGSGTAEILQGGRTLELQVTGTDKEGQAIEGTLTIRLFEDVAPLATGTIVALAQEGFYDGKLFHRILDNFVIQGGSPNGDGIGGSDKPDVDDEFNAEYTFASSGIVAMANARDDNNNSQFFISDIDRQLTDRPQFLNFNHTIVGILTSGFDVYEKIITTNVRASGSGEISSPTQPVTIVKASVIDDTQNAVVKVRGGSARDGTLTVVVTGTDATGETAKEDITLTAVADGVNDRAFLGKLPTVNIVRGTSGSFTIPATDLDNDTLTYAVGSATNVLGTPANAQVSIDQSTGRVTVTPDASFTGTLTFKVGVRDQTDRVGGGANAAGNYDTQTLSITVSATTAATTTTLTTNRTTATPGQNVLLTATVAAGGANATGNVKFFADGTEIGNANLSGGQAVFSTSFSTVGTKSLTASYTPADSNFSASSTASATTVTVALDSTGSAVKIAAASVGRGSAPRVTVTNEDGTTRFTIQAFEDSFTGGVRVAVGDVNDDGQDDVITTAGFGGSPLVRVYDGNTGVMSKEIMVFEESFRGGLYVAVGDVLGRGYAQILVGAGHTGGPRVTLYDVVQNKAVLNYFAYDPNLRTGVSVSLSDLNGDGKPQVLTGVGKGVLQVSVFNPLNIVETKPTSLGSFFAGSESSRDGVRVGAGGILGTGKRDILTGAFEPDESPLTDSFSPAAYGIIVG